ncbi:MAG: hypothetical protein ABIT76_10535 [Chthoniobacterales bacterium]
MKIFSVLAFCAFTISAFAQETAYQALNTVGKVKGQPFLDNLLSLEGLEGGSQPASWRLTFEDNTSRSGFREMEVRGGQIVSQRAPLKSPHGNGSRINLDRLQLDSDGAFTVAEREAARGHVSFARTNYFLEADGESGNPIWRVQLLDTTGNPVQTLRISADSGSMVRANGEAPARVAPNSDYVEETTTRETTTTVADQPDSEGDSTELKIHRTMIRTGRTIKNSFKHVGGSIQEVFTGRRTVDKDLPGE